MGKGCEQFSVNRPDGGLPLGITVLDRRQVKYGGSELKYEITAQCADVFGPEPVSLFERCMGKKYKVDEYLMKYSHILTSGLTTIPLIGYSDESVYHVDMRAAGWEFYGKSYLVMRQKHTRSPKYTKVHDELFRSISHPERIGALHASIACSIEAAARNGVILSWDDPMDLLIHSSGEWTIGVVDIMESRVRSYGGYERCLDQNSIYAKEFTDYLLFIQRVLDGSVIL